MNQIRVGDLVMSSIKIIKEYVVGVIMISLVIGIIGFIIITPNNLQKRFELKQSTSNKIIRREIQREVSLLQNRQEKLESSLQKELVTQTLRLNSQDVLQQRFELKQSILYDKLRQELDLKQTNENKLVDAIKNTIDSVVQIKNLTMRWQGSGVAWTEDIIVTARHVVQGSSKFEIVLNDGRKIKAFQAISDVKYDVGFIKLDKADPNCIKLTPAKFASVKDTVLGQQVYVIGSPYGELNFNSVTLGIVSGINRSFDELNNYNYSNHDYGWSIAFTTDSAGHPGNSGCPVFTLDGKVRGILVGGFSPVLIICMPVDLFIDNQSVIEMMFLQNQYNSEREVYINYDNAT